jgi:hypothetical protein
MLLCIQMTRGASSKSSGDYKQYVADPYHEKKKEIEENQPCWSRVFTNEN